MGASISAQLAKQVGEAVKRAAMERKPEWWFYPLMAAASRAILERIPLVDLVLNVRDARGDWLRSKSIVVLNEMDLANSSQIKWLRHFETKNRHCFAVNAHNTDNIKQFLNYLQARVRELNKSDYPNFTVTIMLVGIPNVGKSALANSLHKIGRISAAEQGKLKHAIVSPDPFETRYIRSLKDFIVQDVRRTLFEEISSHQISQDANDSMKLIEMQMTVL